MTDSSPAALADTPHWLAVLVALPAHSGVTGPLTYRADQPLPSGTLVRVPLGQREVLGIVWASPCAAPEPHEVGLVRPISAALDGIAPLAAPWRQLVDFAARYYQRSAGEVALAVLPPPLRGLDNPQLARRLKRHAKTHATAAPDPIPPPPLTDEQSTVLAQIRTEDGPFLLFGSTGSGKTEVYLRAVAEVLAHDPATQALVMVPEINLTPQLEQRFVQRFAPAYGAQAVVALHSGLTPPQRLRSWLAAHSGQARIVLGTRMAVFASLPGLRLIVVDEEHDPSYKQQEGARYSARDLAIYRGHACAAKVILGSATPSLESWHQSRGADSEHGPGRYRRLHMPSRIGQQGDSGLARVRRVDMTHQPRGTVLAEPLLDAIRSRIARGEQTLLLLNRRGYAPVLYCTDCSWKSACPHCSAFRVFHKTDRSLRCHHCGDAGRVPSACPACGNPDIAPLGRGTEQLEELLADRLQDARRPDGQPPRIARIDADTTRHKGALESQLAEVHAGEVDVLVGTQMVAKGHDFRRVTLVAAVNPDGALFSSDFRAPERLFALLLQAAGRAGRDAAFVNAQASAVEMWVQTTVPAHAVFEALKRHDYPAFAQAELDERLGAGMPPFSFQALVRAEARSQEVAQAFLSAASQAADALATQPGMAEVLAHVTRYAAVPMSLQRVANAERAQLLIESDSRVALQRFLAAWQPLLRQTRADPAHKGLLRWAIDVDPLAI